MPSYLIDQLMDVPSSLLMNFHFLREQLSQNFQRHVHFFAPLLAQDLRDFNWQRWMHCRSSSSLVAMIVDDYQILLSFCLHEMVKKPWEYSFDFCWF